MLPREEVERQGNSWSEDVLGTTAPLLATLPLETLPERQCFDTHFGVWSLICPKVCRVHYFRTFIVNGHLLKQIPS